MRVSFIEPYDGGSHKQFRLNWSENSAHSFQFFTQPPRKWKWRMRGSALSFQNQLNDILSNEAMVASGFLNIAEFWGMASGTSPKRLPTVLMMHENQLTYPVQVEDERDFHYGFTNITSCLTADAVWFNSQFHRTEFLNAIPNYLKRMPDEVPVNVVEKIAAKSKVYPLGVTSPMLLLSDSEKNNIQNEKKNSSRPLRIGWNHRWEFDKNPEVFFQSIRDLKLKKIQFELVVLGEQFRNSPKIFQTAKQEFKNEIKHWGFAKDQKEYANILASCDVVVSTSIHEFFGISVIEAALCGCCLVLPDRLSYPELFSDSGIPKEDIFYPDSNTPLNHLASWATQKKKANERGKELSKVAQKFLWSNRTSAFDGALREILKS